MSKDAEPITFVIDGVEVSAPEGTMLVDAAKRGDVEIPVFCYEPKLGQPVGACRMCLVEIEGIPKLQTACSTPVRDGMVAYTQTDRVREGHSAIVEFLLVNHPLDCPVCDKGGECPLQDIAMGWGPGKSRVTDPKRHFQKPLPLSPLVRIDRERCILCYRCVRFSQEVAEDEQLQLLERGDRSYVGTFNDRPYIAPFHGNIIELCPVGALTSEEYRFRARPWDVEDAGSICTLCPSQCNVKFTVRDERVMRVLARDNAAVDDGWLCDKGRFGFQMIEAPDRITAPLVRSGGELRPAGWAEALEAASRGLRESGERSAGLVAGGTSNEEGYLAQRVIRSALGSPHVDTGRGGFDRAGAAALAAPGLATSVGDIDDAHTVVVIGADPLHEMPIVDLRIRKAVRRNGVRLLVASERPTSLDGGAVAAARYAPGDAAEFVSLLAATAAGRAETHEEYGRHADRIAAELGHDEPIVVIWGERLARQGALSGLLELADALGLAGRAGSGLLSVPEETNARGLREAGCLPGAGPGYAEAPPGRDAEGIREGLESGELTALLLLDADPVRDHPDGPGWERALQSADFVVAFAMFENESTRFADVVFPAESHAEKEGTVTHPDGRLQRLRPGIPHRDELRPGWQVLVELAAALDHELGLNTAPEVLGELAKEVPFLADITHEEIGGQGVRWQERDAASGGVTGAATGASSPGATSPRSGGVSPERPAAARRLPGDGAPASASDARRLRIGTYRDLWSGEVTERNPALRFLAPSQHLELAPADAERLGLEHGQDVSVSSNGHSIGARVSIRERMRPGAGFLVEGTEEGNANRLAGAAAVEVRAAGEEPAS